jgi:uncharacterized protein GlcG (DUF336 family)
VNFETARQVADAVLAEGRRRGCAPLTVAVLDPGGHEVLVYRETGAGFVRPRIALGKAWGALGLGVSSRTVGQIAERVPAFFESMVAATGGRMFPAAGGVLAHAADGALLGAVGVSGDSSDVDEALAVHGLRAADLRP